MLSHGVSLGSTTFLLTQRSLPSRRTDLAHGEEMPLLKYGRLAYDFSLFATPLTYLTPLPVFEICGEHLGPFDRFLLLPHLLLLLLQLLTFSETEFRVAVRGASLGCHFALFEAAAELGLQIPHVRGFA